MSDIEETLVLGSQEATMIINSKYDLTSKAMLLRGQRPLIIGDSYSLQITLQNSDETAFDLTDYTITFTAKYMYEDADVDSIIQKVGAIVGDPTAGVFSISIANDDVDSYNIVRGYYDIQLQDGDSVVTVLVGEIEWLQDVTKTVT